MAPQYALGNFAELVKNGSALSSAGFQSDLECVLVIFQNGSAFLYLQA